MSSNSQPRAKRNLTIAGEYGWKPSSKNTNFRTNRLRKARKILTLDVVHYNCRYLASEERMNEFEFALEVTRWGIIG